MTLKGLKVTDLREEKYTITRFNNKKEMFLNLTKHIRDAGGQREWDRILREFNGLGYQDGDMVLRCTNLTSTAGKDFIAVVREGIVVGGISLLAN